MKKLLFIVRLVFFSGSVLHANEVSWVLLCFHSDDSRIGEEQFLEELATKQREEPWGDSVLGGWSDSKELIFILLKKAKKEDAKVNGPISSELLALNAVLKHASNQRMKFRYTVSIPSGFKFEPKNGEVVKTNISLDRYLKE